MTIYKVLALAAALALAVGAPALAQDDRPPMDIPIYPGAEPTLEINLTNEDLLPTLQAVLPLLGQKFKLDENVSAEDLAAALRDVRRIQVLQVDIDNADVTDSDIAAYYSGNLPAGDWTRFFWQSRQPVGTVALYVRDGGEYIYGFRVQRVESGGTPVRRVTIAKTEGKIDFAKLVMVAGKVFMSS